MSAAFIVESLNETVLCPWCVAHGSAASQLAGPTARRSQTTLGADGAHGRRPAGRDRYDVEPARGERRALPSPRAPELEQRLLPLRREPGLDRRLALRR